ncbi:MAG: PTS glucose transporter subunit IIA, partial [Pygmaiobacter sp.]
NAVAISEVSDPTFGEEILGRGVAIRPSKGRVVSPVSGTIETIFDTGHAVSIHSDEGVDILIHVGLDTIKLAGKGYTKRVVNGQHVVAGDVLIEFDIAAITAAGYDIITPVVICNSTDYASFSTVLGEVSELQSLIQLTKA